MDEAKLKLVLTALERAGSAESIEKYLFNQLDHLRCVAGQSGHHDLARDIASLCVKHKLT